MDYKNKNRETGRVEVSRTEIEDAIFRQIDELKYLSQQNRQTADTISRAVGRFETAQATPVEQRHVHTVEYKTIWIVAGYIVLIILLAVFCFTVRNLKREISGMIDNDLKYRYIEMRGEADTEDILQLREMFDNQRDNAKIKALRQRVEYYERLVKEQAEREARAKLNNEEAERLEAEAEKIKRK